VKFIFASFVHESIERELLITMNYFLAFFKAIF